MTNNECTDCGEPATRTRKHWTWHDRYVLEPVCADCGRVSDQRDEDGPGDPDGEAFRGGEAAAFVRDQLVAAQRLK